MTEDDETPEFGLVMPFVVCDDHGGPFDSSGFVAGYQCGVLNETLKGLAYSVEKVGGTAKVEQYMDPRLLPQVDLIAMQHGFSTSNEPWHEHPDEWTLVTFTLGKQEDDE